MYIKKGSFSLLLFVNPFLSFIMKGLLVAVLSLAVASSTVLAGAHNHHQQSFASRPVDPEGQFPRLGACPDPHACIFPPDV